MACPQMLSKTSSLRLGEKNKCQYPYRSGGGGFAIEHLTRSNRAPSPN